MSKRANPDMDESDWQPPAHLSERSQTIWMALVPQRCRSPEKLTLLQSTLESLDRSDAARTAIANEGMTLTTEGSGVSHAHPLLKTEKESRALVFRGLALLQLTHRGGLDKHPFE